MYERRHSFCVVELTDGRERRYSCWSLGKRRQPVARRSTRWRRAYLCPGNQYRACRSRSAAWRAAAAPRLINRTGNLYDIRNIAIKWLTVLAHRSTALKTEGLWAKTHLPVSHSHRYERCRGVRSSKIHSVLRMFLIYFFLGQHFPASIKLNIIMCYIGNMPTKKKRGKISYFWHFCWLKNFHKFKFALKNASSFQNLRM